jgi:hypothetical protein
MAEIRERAIEHQSSDRRPLRKGSAADYGFAPKFAKASEVHSVRASALARDG